MVSIGVGTLDAGPRIVVDGAGSSLVVDGSVGAGTELTCVSLAPAPGWLDGPPGSSVALSTTKRISGTNAATNAAMTLIQAGLRYQG
jgi:hypothetical protein